MEQESAIDWFFLWFIDNPKGTHEEYLEAYDKAKAMEKEQIMNAHSQGLFGEESNPPISAYSEQYYNETYNK
jgi:hypothetical protein